MLRLIVYQNESNFTSFSLELTIAAEHVCGLKVLTKTVALLL